MTTGKNVRVLKTEGSKQIDDKGSDLFDTQEGVIEPEVGFEELLYAYDNSSIISGIVKKIASKIDSGFVESENKELNQILEKIDIEGIAHNFLVFGNSFSERLKNIKGDKMLELEPILTHTIRIVSKQKRKKVKYYQRSKRGLKRVGFKKDEILFFKRGSLGDKHYGDSLFHSCIDEVVLLAFITKYYKNFFKGGNIEPNILFDKNGTLTDDQIDKIESMIQSKISGIDNSHNTLFLSGEIGKVDLTTKIDPDKFIQLKRELKEDISISTNIPFDLLSSQDSNRANSEVAIKSLYSDIIIPNQTKILRQLKKQLLLWRENEKNEGVFSNISEDDIENIEFAKVDLKNGLDEMKIATGYKKAGIMTPNEVRKKLGLEDIVGGDELQTSGGSEFDNKEDTEMDKIEKNVQKSYSGSKWSQFLNKVGIGNK